jgi:hypothetical protein
MEGPLHKHGRENGIVTRTRLGLIMTLIGIVALAACAPPSMWFRPVRFQAVQPAASSGVNPSMDANDLREELEASPAKAVLLPFADYSAYDTPRPHTHFHAFLQERLVNELRKAGMEKGVAVGQDVALFLLHERAILDAAPILAESSPQTALLLGEFNGDWSEPASDRIGRAVHQNMIEMRTLGGSWESLPLDNAAISRIAEAFSAHYVVRGRMTVYETGLEWNTYPYPTQALAFYFPGADEKVPRVGIASLDAYERFGQGPVAPPAASIRSEENQPSEDWVQRVSPFLRLDLFIQDAGTGEVVYSNSSLVSLAELDSVAVEAYPQPREVLEAAIGRAVVHVLDPLT